MGKTYFNNMRAYDEPISPPPTRRRKRERSVGFKQTVVYTLFAAAVGITLFNLVKAGAITLSPDAMGFITIASLICVMALVSGSKKTGCDPDWDERHYNIACQTSEWRRAAMYRAISYVTIPITLLALPATTFVINVGMEQFVPLTCMALPVGIVTTMYLGRWCRLLRTAALNRAAGRREYM